MLNNIEISNELLSEVLGYKVDYIASVGETYIGFHTEMGGKNINIYELAHRCKEWAFKQDYSYLGNKGLINIYNKTGTIVTITDKNVVNWFDIYIDFKACEWILKEINSK